MDIHTIAKRTRLPTRKIRYVLDHRLLPGMRVKTDADRLGHPRSFTDLEGFGIACAATLLVGGVKRDAAFHFMESLCRYVWDEPHKQRRSLTILEKAFASPADVSACALFGDGLNVRFRIGSRDTNWLQPGTFAELKQFCPRLTICLDLGRLRDALRD